MRIDIISAVPELLSGPFDSSIIKKINGTVINSIADIDKIVKSRNYYDPVTIEILTTDNKTERFNFR